MQIKRMAVLMQAAALAQAAAGHDAGKVAVAVAPITVQYLDGFFREVSAIGASREEATKMQVFVQSALTMDTASFKAVMKAYAGKEHQTELHKGQPTEAVESAYSVARTRTKEARQIYGAAKFGGVDVAPLGWRKAYETAISVLKARKILWDGSAELSAEEKATKAERKAVADTMREAGIRAAKLIETGKVERGAINLENIADDVASERDSVKAVRIARSIVKAHGLEMAELVAALIPDAIARGKAIEGMTDEEVKAYDERSLEA